MVHCGLLVSVLLMLLLVLLLQLVLLLCVGARREECLRGTNCKYNLHTALICNFLLWQIALFRTTCNSCMPPFAIPQPLRSQYT